MKWRILKIGRAKLAIGEKRSLHSGIGFRTGCGSDFIGEYIAFYWNGVTKWEQITNLKHKRELKKLGKETKDTDVS